MSWMILFAGILSVAVGMQAQAAVIADSGQSAYQIVVPDGPTPAVSYAARELQRFVRDIAGVRLPVVSERESGDGSSFLLGPCRRSVKAGLVDQARKLREDGVLIKTLGDDIALLGQNERGNLYSVYVLLEKYLGVRFLAWDCTVVPKSRELTLPELDYSYAPPFMYRETLYFDSFPKQISARQRLNGPFSKCDASVGGKVDIYPYVHSFDDLFPPEDYEKDHPEYFGIQGGKRVAAHIHSQLCLTNPDVLRLTKEKVLKWIQEHPDIPIMDVSQNDGNGPCECENCVAIVNEEGSQHGPILRFVNDVADEVAKKHPDKWIETLAYAYSIKPPAITKPRPNVLIRLCHVGCYFHGFEACGLGSNFAGYLDEWSKLTKRIFIWHYAADFAHWFAPVQNLNGLAKDIKYYSIHNVNGLMVQSNFVSPGSELAELRQYLSAQLMWDPSQDPMKIRTEFCEGYYGNASGDVLEFLRLMDKTAEDPNVHAFGAWDPQNTVSPEFVRGSLAILERARSVSGNRAVRNRVDKLMLPYWYMQLSYTTKYGLSDTDAPAVWKQMKRVILANKIIYVNEGAKIDGWMANMDARFAPLAKDVAFDLMRMDRATTKNCADWRAGTVKRDGRGVPTVFQHPNSQGDGDAAYEIALPALPSGEKLLLKFGTVITNKSADGVRFAVLVNDKELWSETKTAFLPPEEPASKSVEDSIMPSASPFSDVALDISAYSGQTVRLTLRVNALSNNNNDWSNWIEPRVILTK